MLPPLETPFSCARSKLRGILDLTTSAVRIQRKLAKPQKNEANAPGENLENKRKVFLLEN
jgi:hypothetical protein